MCIAPMRVWVKSKQAYTETACHKCWQCRENLVNDWVGRNIAESRTAKAAHAVTLTYGRDGEDSSDHIRARLLTYSDVQKYLKRLRAAGFPVRYFAVGEYGSERGRAHWHVMLYWLTDRVPPHNLQVREVQAYWPHGWSFWEKPEHHAIRYNCKYIQKSMGGEDAQRQGHMAMSTRPPLGAAYFKQLALRHVLQGLAPQDATYSFPDVLGKDGQPIQFYLAKDSASRELYIRAFISQWAEVYGDKRTPPSPFIDDWVAEGHLDPLTPYGHEVDAMRKLAVRSRSNIQNLTLAAIQTRLAALPSARQLVGPAPMGDPRQFNEHKRREHVLRVQLELARMEISDQMEAMRKQRNG